MSIRSHSEGGSYNDMQRRKRYSHPIRAIHYSAPEEKGRQSREKRKITQEER